MLKHYFWTWPFKRGGFTTGETRKNPVLAYDSEILQLSPADNYYEMKNTVLYDIILRDDQTDGTAA